MALIHERIKQRRAELGYTLLYVADKLNIKEATIQRYESGAIKNIKHETITALSEILHCEPAYLMGWSDSPIKDEYEMLYEQLDEIDKAEIRGEMKHMLKADKYNSVALGDVADDVKNEITEDIKKIILKSASSKAK